MHTCHPSIHQCPAFTRPKWCRPDLNELRGIGFVIHCDTLSLLAEFHVPWASFFVCTANCNAMWQLCVSAFDDWQGLDCSGHKSHTQFSYSATLLVPPQVYVRSSSLLAVFNFFDFSSSSLSTFYLPFLVSIAVSCFSPVLVSLASLHILGNKFMDTQRNPYPGPLTCLLSTPLPPHT